MPVSLVQIESYLTEAEAECVRNWLESHGVEAFIEGSVSSTVLSHISSVLPGVRLLVSPVDVLRAEQLLLEYRTKDVDAVSWFCTDCRETNEPSFDICWNCGGDRAQVGAPVPAQDVAVGGTAARKEQIDWELLPTAASQTASANPYHVFVAPTPQAKQTAAGDARPLSLEEADEMIQRAHRAAIIGFFLPVIPSVYSVFLLILSTDANEISAKSRQRRKIAWIINAVLLIGIILILQSEMISRYLS